MPAVDSLPSWVADLFGDKKCKVPQNRGSINLAYVLDRSHALGEGSFGRVFRARHLVKKDFTFAVKEADKKQANSVFSPEDMGGLRHEMDIIQALDHPSIVKVIETFEDSKNFWLVLELCEGGRVDDFLVQLGHYTEKDASRIMQQVLGATGYMHNKNICHRDLKPQNFLLQSRSPIESNILKVADFGLACACRQGRELTQMVGSLEYMAPQVLDKSYDLSADLWSCGVVLFLLLCGHLPFQSDSEEKIKVAIRRGNYRFQSEEWRDISEDAKYLVKGLLEMNPERRLTADRACDESWVRNGASRPTPLKIAMRNLRGRPSFKGRQQAGNAGADSGVLGWMEPVVHWANNVLHRSWTDFVACDGCEASRSDEVHFALHIDTSEIK